MHGSGVTAVAGHCTIICPFIQSGDQCLPQWLATASEALAWRTLQRSPLACKRSTEGHVFG